jgi:hypothetical protein
MDGYIGLEKRKSQSIPLEVVERGEESVVGDLSRERD